MDLISDILNVISEMNLVSQKMPLLLPKFTHFFFCVNSLNHSLGQSNKENIDNSEVQSMTLKKTKYLGTNITC